MQTEKIPVRVTQSGQIMDVVVYDKRVDHITVVIGEGAHSMKCELTPTRTGQAYAELKGSASINFPEATHDPHLRHDFELCPGRDLRAL